MVGWVTLRNTGEEGKDGVGRRMGEGSERGGEKVKGDGEGGDRKGEQRDEGKWGERVDVRDEEGILGEKAAKQGPKCSANSMKMFLRSYPNGTVLDWICILIKNLAKTQKKPVLRNV